MKTALVCAILLGQFAAEAREPAPATARRCVRPSAGAVVITRETISLAHRVPAPAPVAEMTTGDGPTIEGAFLRLTTAPKPLQMLNPTAPPEYGSARSLVTFDFDDPNRTSNPNIRHLNPQPDGIRLLTLRTSW